MADPPSPADQAEVARKLAEEAEHKLKGTVLDGGGGSSEQLPLATLAAAPTQRPRLQVAWPQLTRMNYTIWAMKMRVALQSAHVWEATQSVDVDYDMNRDALLTIYSAVPDSIMTSLAVRDSA